MGLHDHLSGKNYIIGIIMVLTSIPFSEVDVQVAVLKVAIGITAASVYLYDTADTEQKLSQVAERAKTLSKTIDRLKKGEEKFDEIHADGVVSANVFSEGSTL